MAAAATTVEKFVASSKRRLRLVAAQVAGGLDEGEQMAAQSRSLILEISAAQLETEEATELSTAICKMGWTKAVSYTHLTLPTILLV